MATKKSTPRPRSGKVTSDPTAWIDAIGVAFAVTKPHATKARVDAWVAEERAICERPLPPLPPRVERARLLAARLTYAADMLESELGSAAVREDVGQWVDRLHLAAVGLATPDGPRWLVLLAVICEASQDGPKTPEERVRVALLTVGQRAPDLAARLDVDVAAVVALLPLWRGRRRAGGAGGRAVRLWPAIVELGVSAGLRKIGEEALKALWKAESPNLLPYERE